MGSILKTLLASQKGGKEMPVLRAVTVIGSGLLSSTALAAALKAWLENRRTKVTIQIEGRRRTLTYEGHHLERDSATLQAMMTQLGEHERDLAPNERVRVSVVDEAGALQPALLTSGLASANSAASPPSASTATSANEADAAASGVSTFTAPTLWQRFLAWMGEQQELFQRHFLHKA